MDDKKEAAEKRRAAEDAAVKERMKNPQDNLCHTGLSAYRWAPRKQIEKDQDAIRRLYGEDE